MTVPYSKPRKKIVYQKDVPLKGLDFVASLGPDMAHILKQIKQLRDTSDDSVVTQCAKIILDMYKDIGNAMRKGTIEYLQHTYQDMWNVSSYFTGNLRGSLTVKGNLETNPWKTDIGIDYTEFRRRKELQALHDQTVTISYDRKKTKDTVTKTYTRYKKNQTVMVGGDNYVAAQNYSNHTSKQEADGPEVGGPFVYTVWREIKNKYRKEYK